MHSTLRGQSLEWSTCNDRMAVQVLFPFEYPCHQGSTTQELWRVLRLALSLPMKTQLIMWCFLIIGFVISVISFVFYHWSLWIQPESSSSIPCMQHACSLHGHLSWGGTKRVWHLPCTDSCWRLLDLQSGLPLWAPMMHCSSRSNGPEQLKWDPPIHMLNLEGLQPCHISIIGYCDYPCKWTK